MGWTGAAIPEEYGGAGLGHLGLCVLAEELGAALAPVPFSSSVYLASEAIIAGGSEAQKKAWLPKLASGEVDRHAGAGGRARQGRRAQAAHHLPRRHLERREAARARWRCRRRRHRRRPGRARHRAGDRRSARRPASPREPVETIDPSRSHARIGFDGAPAETLGAPGDGERLLRRVQDRAAVLFAFEQVGGAQRSLEMARDYALQRYAFGRPIGSFQAIKHKLADVYVATELARSNAYYGAWALARDAPELPDGRRRRPHLGQRGLFPGGQGEHPGARRHGLHLGVRLPPLLPPRQAARRWRSAARGSGRTA